MKKSTLELYHRFRSKKPFMLVGYDAQQSLRAARILEKFRELESRGLVRMRAEPEEESYFDVFGDLGPYERNGHRISKEQWEEQIGEMIDEKGCWWTTSEYFDGKRWQHADSCGMHTGYKDPLDPFENCYVIDEMAAAIHQLEEHWGEPERNVEHDFATA